MTERGTSPTQYKGKRRSKMAGLAGFEPAHDGIKTRCLTAWRQPNYGFGEVLSACATKPDHCFGRLSSATKASFSCLNSTKTQLPVPVILAGIDNF